MPASSSRRKSPSAKPLQTPSSSPPNYRHLAFRLGEISIRLTRGASRVYSRHFGISGLEWRLVSMLYEEPGVTANHVCQVVGLDKGAVSRAVAHLAGLGVLTAEAGPQGGRQRFMHLTAKGFELHDKVLVVALQREERLLAGISSDEADRLMELLARVSAAVDSANLVGDSKRD
jgi:DNA-binding MarR family transcriptional regulator